MDVEPTPPAHLIIYTIEGREFTDPDAAIALLHILFWKDVAEHAPGMLSIIKKSDYTQWLGRKYRNGGVCLATHSDFARHTPARCRMDET